MKNKFKSQLIGEKDSFYKFKIKAVHIFDKCGWYSLIHARIDSFVPVQHYPKKINCAKLMNYQRHITRSQRSFKM